jgi:hypothetical protein
VGSQQGSIDLNSPMLQLQDVDISNEDSVAEAESKKRLSITDVLKKP